jgi:hypothetical protein
VAKPARRRRSNPVELALARNRWQTLLTHASLAAFWSDDLDQIIEKSMSLLYIAGRSAHKADCTLPETRIIHGACRTALECSTQGRMTEEQRATLHSGLEAARRLQPHITGHLFIESSLHLATLIRTGGACWSDFAEFVPMPT